MATWFQVSSSFPNLPQRLEEASYCFYLIPVLVLSLLLLLLLPFALLPVYSWVVMALAAGLFLLPAQLKQHSCCPDLRRGPLLVFGKPRERRRRSIAPVCFLHIVISLLLSTVLRS